MLLTSQAATFKVTKQRMYKMDSTPQILGQYCKIYSLMTWMMRQNAPLASLQKVQNAEDWVCCYSGGPQQDGETGWQKPHKVPQKEIYLQISEVLWSWVNKSVKGSVKNTVSSQQTATVSLRREIHGNAGDSLRPVWKLHCSMYPCFSFPRF